ncbi:MAG: Abi family protein [Endomicrobium sp.]|jgi:abortive infection bacteriophage resistance protein|nr:Abi family protein [Endomicrobium sp.]
MKYTKPVLTYEQQAELLISRGLIADKSDLINKLKEVNYSRLSSYLDPYFDLSTCKYKTGTDFKFVWENYTFDRRLRLVVLDAIERIEISIRAKLVYEFTNKYGAFGYLDKKKIPNIDNDRYNKWLSEIQNEASKSKEVFIQNFYKNYSLSKDLPIWILVEIMTFGKLLTFFRGVDDNIRKTIASCYNTNDEVFKSWMLTLNTIRNICAHHSRLWDKILVTKPKIPRLKHDTNWSVPLQIKNTKIFCILTILAYLIKIIAPQSKWKSRLLDLFNDYKNIPLYKLGFPKGWENIDMWKN